MNTPPKPSRSVEEDGPLPYGTSSLLNPQFKRFDQARQVKDLTFIGTPASVVSRTLTHENSLNIQRLFYHSGSNQFGRVAGPMDLRRALTHPLPKLRSISIDFSQADTGRLHTEAIREAGFVHTQLAHLRIDMKGFKSSDIITIFSNNNFAQLETLVIERMSGEMTLPILKAMEHLRLKKLSLWGMTISDDLLARIHKVDWFSSLTHISLGIQGALSHYQSNTLIGALGENVEEIDILPHWKGPAVSTFLSAIQKRLSRGSFQSLKRLVVTFSPGDQLDALYQCMINPKAWLVIRVYDNTRTDPMIVALSKCENVILDPSFNQILSTCPSAIRSEFVDGMCNDQTPSYTILRRIIILIIILIIIALIMYYSMNKTFY